MSNPDFEFWYSPLLKLEAILQPTLGKRKIELAFYETYFNNAACFGDLNLIYEIAEREALRHGIEIADAMHIGAAYASKCKFLFTTEKATKPMFRTRLVKVVRVLAPA